MPEDGLPLFVSGGNFVSPLVPSLYPRSSQFLLSAGVVWFFLAVL